MDAAYLPPSPFLSHDPVKILDTPLTVDPATVALYHFDNTLADATTARHAVTGRPSNLHSALHTEPGLDE